MSIAVHRSIRLRLQRSNTLVIPSHLIIKVKNWLIINDDELFYVKLKSCVIRMIHLKILLNGLMF